MRSSHNLGRKLALRHQAKNKYRGHFAGVLNKLALVIGQAKSIRRP